MSEIFKELRKEYHQSSLDEKDLDASPFEQFDKWFNEAVAAHISHPDAMTLATTTAEGSPDARIVLLKEITPDGFIFYSNYMSAKGRQLAINYSATLLFFWPELERQVRIKGSVEKTDNATSDVYFSSRPRSARLSAIASPQSEPVPNRKWLESELAKVETSLKDREPERPQNWGGFVLKAHEFEFWQGRDSRLHDRLRYRKERSGSWKISRLAP